MPLARWLTVLLMVGIGTAFVADTPVYLDIYCRDDDTLVFGNALVELTLDKQTGRWLSWTDKTGAENLLTPDETLPSLDFSINGTYQIASYKATFLRKTIAVDTDRRGSVLSVTTGILPQTGGYAYELTTSYRLYPQQKRLERWAHLVRHKLGAAEHLDGFRFQLPGVSIGQTAENTVTVPGPFFTGTFVAPDTPYDSLRARFVSFHSAPDAGFGLVRLTNKPHKTTLGSWLSTSGEVAYTTALQGNGKTITIRHDDKRAYYLLPDMAVDSDTQHVELSETPAEINRAYRQNSTATMPPDPATPTWVKEQVILEVYPKYYKGGLHEITARLPFYKAIGFTMIYLMPHWEGGYSPIDPFRIDTSIGTPADLKRLVTKAHALGLKVIFDMVIHGFNPKSPVPKLRPELFVHNEQGALALHPTWKSITTDWFSPAYQQYMTDLVLHDQREYGNDGYRVDAATFKGAGWNPTVPYPAYCDGSAAPALMRKMLTALRRKNSGAVLLSEVFGPVFYSVCNFAHDNQTEAVPFLLEKMAAGSYTAAGYKQHIQDVYALLPAGANRVFFARNHDTSWFYHFDGYTDRFMAFEAVHALFGIPEVFAGDPDHRFNPDDDPRVYRYYQNLFTFKKQFPELSRGEVRLAAVQCNNQQLFSGVRTLAGRSVLVLTSFSDQPQTALITLDSSVQVRPGKHLMLSLSQPGEPLPLTNVGPRTYRITLSPFQTAAGRLN